MQKFLFKTVFFRIKLLENKVFFVLEKFPKKNPTEKVSLN